MRLQIILRRWYSVVAGFKVQGREEVRFLRASPAGRLKYVEVHLTQRALLLQNRLVLQPVSEKHYMVSSYLDVMIG